LDHRKAVRDHHQLAEAFFISQGDGAAQRQPPACGRPTLFERPKRIGSSPKKRWSAQKRKEESGWDPM
jgi:hypothetical protein